MNDLERFKRCLIFNSIYLYVRLFVLHVCMYVSVWNVSWYGRLEKFPTCTILHTATSPASSTAAAISHIRNQIHFNSDTRWNAYCPPERLIKNIQQRMKKICAASSHEKWDRMPAHAGWGTTTNKNHYNRIELDSRKLFRCEKINQITTTDTENVEKLN